MNAAEWQDTDADNIGDNADVDDDNDGWSDSQEQSRGTDPLRKDTDGDGVNDPQDYYPLDPLKSVQEQTRNIFQPPTNQATTQEPAAGNQEGPIETLQDLQNQLNDITGSAETARKLEEQPIEKLSEVVEKVSGSSKKFFSLNNYLLWLILAIVLVIGAIVLVFLKTRKPGQKAMDSLKKEAFKAAPAVIQTKVKPSLAQRKLPPNVINLKDLTKKK